MSSSFDRLHQFISKKMRMSHIYQPAMILQLLVDGGRSSINSVAKSLQKIQEVVLEVLSQINKNTK